MTQHTRWHKCVDLMKMLATSADVPQSDDIGSEIVRATQKFSRAFFAQDTPFDIPVFIINPVGENDKAIFYSRDGDTGDFIIFANSVDIFPWPFDVFVIELWHEKASTFLYVIRSGDKTFHFIALEHLAHNETMFFMALSDVPGDGGITEVKFNINQYWAKLLRDADLNPHDELSTLIGGFRSLMLQLATKGIVQERTEAPPSLNKHRIRKGKCPVPTVIHMRPGYYYDRSGERHEYDARNPVRMHWRRGHTRNQWVGTGDERHQEIRYIAPCLVNYDGGDQPTHKVRVLH